MNILLLGGGPAAEVLIVVMFCVHRIKKIEKKRKKLADTSEPAANSIIQTIKHLLCVGWRNFFYSCAVVSVFGSGGE